ncbi:MAG: Ltp family lipoprotein [Marmoricola sp.]|nr:Ltp family lipoprotein [Marmoricola sp.]
MVAAGALALGGCAWSGATEDTGTLAESGTTTADTPITIGQQNAINSVQAYLGTGTGYSRSALIQLLRSPAGGGYDVADIAFAISYVEVDWNAEAVLAAKAYLAAHASSRAGLVRRLSARGGEGFTPAEAAYAAAQVGL